MYFATEAEDVVFLPGVLGPGFKLEIQDSGFGAFRWPNILGCLAVGRYWQQHARERLQESWRTFEHISVLLGKICSSIPTFLDSGVLKPERVLYMSQSKSHHT